MTAIQGESLPTPGSTERTVIKRLAEKAVEDRGVGYDILDAGFVAHVSVADEHRPALRGPRRICTRR